MTKPPIRRTEFLERKSYRQRRYRDGARVIPLFGAVLMMLPLMWPRGESLTSSGMIYLFGLWFVLVILAFVLSRVLRFETAEDAGDASTGPEA